MKIMKAKSFYLARGAVSSPKKKSNLLSFINHTSVHMYSWNMEKHCWEILPLVRFHWITIIELNPF